MAWWIHDRIDAYADLTFFPRYAAFNVSWQENSTHPKSIYSYIENPHTNKKSGYLTKEGMSNFTGSHEEFYKEFVQEL